MRLAIHGSWIKIEQRAESEPGKKERAPSSEQNTYANETTTPKDEQIYSIILLCMYKKVSPNGARLEDDAVCKIARQVGR